MATIRKKGDRQWHVQIRRKGYPAASGTFTTRAKAEKWASVIESEMVRGMYVNRSEIEAISLREGLDLYERKVSVLKKSYIKEKSIIRLWLARPIAARSLASIRSVDIAKYRDERLKEAGAATVRNEMALLSHFFNVAARDWWPGLTNPVIQVRKPKPVRARDRRLSDIEIDKIIDATGSIELPAILRLLVETGMRRSELSRLMWKNVDLLKQTAFLPDTKNGESRMVPLSSRARTALTAMPRRIDGRVFTIKGDSITQAFARACARAGIENARIHDLRHEAVSRLFEMDLNIMEVASVSGHKSLSMLKRYTHLKAENLAKKLG